MKLSEMAVSMQMIITQLMLVTRINRNTHLNAPLVERGTASRKKQRMQMKRETRGPRHEEALLLTSCKKMYLISVIG